MKELTNWNYGASVERVRPMVMKLKNITLDVYHELWEAREALSSRYHRDGTDGPTWAQYCEDIGLVKRTVNRWLTGYDANERRLIDVPKPTESLNDVLADFKKATKECRRRMMAGPPDSLSMPDIDPREMYRRLYSHDCDVVNFVATDIRFEEAWIDLFSLQHEGPAILAKKIYRGISSRDEYFGKVAQQIIETANGSESESYETLKMLMRIEDVIRPYE